MDSKVISSSSPDFNPTDKSPRYGVTGNGSEVPARGPLGKWLPGGEKYGTEGVSTKVSTKGAMGKFLPEGRRYGTDGV